MHNTQEVAWRITQLNAGSGEEKNELYFTQLDRPGSYNEYLRVDGFLFR